MNTKQQISTGAYIWYIIFNIFTFASLYFLKITIMKAIIDSKQPLNNVRVDQVVRNQQ